MAIQPNFHWQFNEREGNIATDSISGVEGHLNNAIFPKHDRIGSAISLGTPTSYVEFGNEVGQFGIDDFTITFGMLYLGNHGQTNLDIIGNRSVNGHGNWVSLRLYQERLFFEVDENSSAKNYIRAHADKILKNNKWYHVAVVRQGATIRVYLDGVLQAEATSDTGVANINNGVDLRLGNFRQGTPRAFYEDLRIYHTALDEPQIQNLIPSVNRLIPSGSIPNFHWQFHEREGSIVTDSISGIEGKLNTTTFEQYGGIGPAIRFRNLESHVQFGGGAGQFGISDFTIAFGMLKGNMGSLQSLDIIGNRSVTSHGNWVGLRIHDVDRLRFEVDQDSNGTKYISAQTGKILKNNKWYHVAVVRQGATIRVYLDGVLQAEATSATGIANIENDVALRLGHYVKETASALYEDLRIYHTALNQVQIQNLIPPVNRLLYPGQIELVANHGARVILAEDEADLFRFTPQFQRLRFGPNTGATVYKGSNFTGAFQKLYTDVPDISLTKVEGTPRSVHIWSSVGDPFTGDWIIKAPNGQNLSRNKHSLTTSPTHTDTELFNFHHQPNFDLPLLIPTTSQNISQLRVGDETAVLVVDDSEQHKDAFSITHPERDEWLLLNADDTFGWTQQSEARAIFHRVIKIANNEGQAGELKVGEVALYQHRAYFGKTWIFSDSEQNGFGNFMSLSSVAGLDNQISSIRLGPDTGVTLFANENQVVNDAKRETEIEDFVDNEPRMAETQIGNDNLSSFKIFRTAAQDAIFTSVTSKLSQDYRMVNDELEEFSSYRSILRMAPNITEVEVSATDLTTIEVEGNLFEIDEVRSVTLRPNLLQQIMITSEADGLSTPGLKFRTGDMTENQFVVIFPDQGAHQQIAELEDDALWNATDAKGNLIVDQSKHTPAEIANVQSTIKRTMAAVITVEDESDPNTNVKPVAGFGATVSTKQVLATDVIDNPWTLNFQASPASTIPEGSVGLVQTSPNIWEEPLDQNSFEQLFAQAEIAIEPDTTSSTSNLEGNFAALRIGGFFSRIGDAVKDAVKVTLGVVEGAFNAIIDLGGRIVRFVLDTAKKVADFVTAVVEKVVESIKQFIEFLRFLFNWGDILETKRFLVETINNAFDSASDMVESAKEPVAEFFDSLQEGLEDGTDSLIRLIGVDPEEAQEDGFELPEAAEWFLNKLLGGGVAGEAIDGAKEVVSEELSDVLEDLAQLDLPPILEAFLSILEQIQQLPQVGNRIRDEVLVEAIETLIANPLRPELVIFRILEALKTVIGDLLAIGENIALTFMDIVVEAIEGIRDLLNRKIPIPFISALFKLIGGGDLTILNVTSMLLAIPTTIVSKLLFGEAPFKNMAQPAFPTQVAANGFSSVTAQSVAVEAEIDKDNQRRKVIGFGVIAITADLLNGIITLMLDTIPEGAEKAKQGVGIEEEAIGELMIQTSEIVSLLLSGFSWLARFPASRVEAGGYPYNIALPENKVSKSGDEQEYWERVVWAWRTSVLCFDFAYMTAAVVAANSGSDIARKYFPIQRMRRANEFTIGFTVAVTAVDIGLTGRYLHAFKENKRGREITNEIFGWLPPLFCWLRLSSDPIPLASLAVINATSLAVTAGLNIAILADDIRELL